MVELNKIHNIDCLEGMRQLDDCSVQCMVTSPPYWGLRDYGSGVEAVWGGDAGCEHEWKEIDVLRKATPGDRPSSKSQIAGRRSNAENRPGKASNYCSKCGAWKGQLGLEPTPELYVKHLCDIFAEVKRVLRNDGTIWLNIGDTYYSKGGASRHKGYHDPKYPNGRNGEFEEPQTSPHEFLKAKDLVGIPWRVAFALQKELGLYLRQALIWHKPNAMPSSVRDRPTTDYEFIFMFSKSEKYYYDADAVLESKKPNEKGRNCRAVWSFNTVPCPEAHFAKFPEELPERCIKAGSREGDVVLDPFAGVGTTLYVAKRLSRLPIGFEISEEYCNMARRRLCQSSLLSTMESQEGFRNG